MIVTELAAFFLAALLPTQRLRALRVQLLLCAGALVPRGAPPSTSPSEPCSRQAMPRPAACTPASRTCRPRWPRSAPPQPHCAITLPPSRPAATAKAASPPLATMTSTAPRFRRRYPLTPQRIVAAGATGTVYISARHLGQRNGVDHMAQQPWFRAARQASCTTAKTGCSARHACASSYQSRSATGQHRHCSDSAKAANRVCSECIGPLAQRSRHAACRAGRTWP